MPAMIMTATGSQDGDQLLNLDVDDVVDNVGGVVSHTEVVHTALIDAHNRTVIAPSRKSTRTGDKITIQGCLGRHHGRSLTLRLRDFKIGARRVRAGMIAGYGLGCSPTSWPIP
eukprot:2395539-Rhodomonas_salina.1